jgi:hypothetical protein
MKVLINGELFFNNRTDQLFQTIDQNTYNSIGDAITSKITEAIHHTEWYNHTPYNFDLVKNFNDVQAYCGNDAACYMDSLNWSIMNKTELTTDIYKFITYRVSVVKDGFAHNFWPSDHAQHILNFIDWHFVLDCISWFI